MMTLTWIVSPRSNQQLIDHTLWRLLSCVLGQFGSQETLSFSTISSLAFSNLQVRTQMVKVQGNQKILCGQFSLISFV
jgi:hypothetical protein